VRIIPLYSESFKPGESLRPNELGRAEIPPERMPPLPVPKIEAIKSPFSSAPISNPEPSQVIETISDPAPFQPPPEAKTLETAAEEAVFIPPSSNPPPKQDQPQKAPQFNKYQEQISSLKHQISSKKHSLSNLSKTISSFQQEKHSIQNEVQKIILDQNLLIKTLSSKVT
jgi:hypothetical protein